MFLRKINSFLTLLVKMPSYDFLTRVWVLSSLATKNNLQAKKFFCTQTTQIYANK